MPTSDFESSFADISYSKLQDEGRLLLPYNVGFEIVDKDDKETRAVGIYVFKINDLVLYAPAFYINGEVKPMVLLYLPKQEVFLPLTEEYINHILKKATQVLGNSVPLPSDNIFMQPSLENLITPPRTGRYVMASLKEESRLRPNILSEFCKEYPADTLKIFTDNPSLLKQAHDFGILQNILKNIKSKPIVKPKKKLIKEADDDFVIEVRKLPENERELALSNKFVIVDKTNNLQQLYSNDYTDRFFNPVENGIYSVIDAYGNLLKCLIIINPKSLNEMYSVDGAFVYDLDNSNYTVVPTEDIWCTKEQEKDLDLNNPVALKNTTCGCQEYFLLSSDCLDYRAGKASVPFVINNLVKGESIFLDIIPVCLGDLPLKDGINQGEDQETIPCNIKLYFTDSDSTNLTSIGTAIIVPKSYELHKCSGRILLGDTSNLRYRVMNLEKFSELKIRSDQIDHYVMYKSSNWKRVGGRDGLAEELLNIGLNKNSIYDVMYDLTKNSRNEYLVKESFLNPTYGYDTNYGLPVQYPTEYVSPVNPNQSFMPPTMYPTNNEQEMSPADLGNSLAAIGDKDLFEHGVLALLAMNKDTFNTVSSYIPTLNAALDKLGRLLFLFWYKVNDFKKYYQIHEYNKYETILIDTFKNLGKIVLSIQKRALPFDTEVELIGGE